MTPCFAQMTMRCVAQAPDVRLHERRGAGEHERQDADSGRQVDDRLGLPAQQAPVQVVLVPILGDVAEEREARRLGMDDGVEVRVGPLDGIVVHAEV